MDNMARRSERPEISNWQLQCSELKQRAAHLLQSGEWSDCSFSVGSEPQVVLSAHKFILAMATPVFEAMFYGSMAAKGNKPIPIIDVQPEAFKALLEYIYMDKINLSSLDKACELCYVAKKYMLPHLAKECIRYLWSAVQPKNACQIYEFARLLEENVLLEKCLQVISLNTKEVLADSSFEEIDLDTMITVFSLEHLNVDSELDLFEAVTRFAKRQNERPSNEEVLDGDSSPEAGDAEPGRAEPETVPSGPDARPEKSEKSTIRSAIEKIRFLTLSPQQFAEGPVLRSPLLAESEAFAVLINISSSRSDVPLPRGFSTSREPRKQLIGSGPNLRQISVSKSFLDFITQEFRSRNMELMAPPLESGLKLIPLLTFGPRPVQINCSCSYENFRRFNTYRSEIHYFCYCPRFTSERLQFEVVCRAYKVDPFSEDTKKHKETVKALDVFFDQIKTKSR